MKGGKPSDPPHIVPLSDAALALLTRIPRIADNPWLFPGWGRRTTKPLSNMSMLVLPAPVQFGPRRIVWIAAEIEHWQQG
jgi:hypothetical protein